MALYIPNARQQFTNANGVPLASGTVGMYVVGTLTPKNTWQDSAETTLNANPIPLDSGGFATIYGDGQYRQIVKDSLGNVVWDRTVYQYIDGSALSFTQTGTGATSRTAQSKFQDTISVKDFGAVGDGVTDDTSAINAAATAAAGKALYFPGATYLTSDAIAIPSNCRVYGDGPSSLIKSTTLANLSSNGGQRQFDLRGVSNIVIENLNFDCSALTVFGNGTRNIYCTNGSSNYTVRNCTAKTPGAFVASVGSSYYRVLNNDVTFSATDSTSHNDGAIDNWGGSNNAIIQGNSVNGSGVTKYAILVTGENTDHTPNGCYKFLISGNRLTNVALTGIWSQGLDGVNSDIQISDNQIDTVGNVGAGTGNHGIEVADTKRFTVTGNSIRNIIFNGIRLDSVTPGSYGVSDGTVYGNVIEDTNMGVSTSDFAGSAVSVLNNGTRISVGANTVKGSNHRWAVYFLSTTTSCELVGGGALTAGTQGTVYNVATATRTPGYNTYTPTLSAGVNVSASTPYVTRFRRVGDVVKVNGRVDITPTAGSSTSTSLNISLPIASNITSATTDLAGVAATGFGTVASIQPDTTNHVAQIKFPSPGTSSTTFYFAFEYTVK